MLLRAKLYLRIKPPHRRKSKTSSKQKKLNINALCDPVNASKLADTIDESLANCSES